MRIAGIWHQLLRAAVAEPDRRVTDLPLLTPAETHRILVEWNDTKTEYPSDKCIQELFEEQVARRTDAVAVTCEGQSLTYGQLNAQANRLARKLVECGVKPDTLVGLCMDRSNDLVIAILAILKAGGAYLPIDLSYPAERQSKGGERHASRTYRIHAGIST